MTAPPKGQRSISRDEAPRPEEAGRLPTKGRGTVWAIEHRYSRQTGESYDDGWGTLDQEAAEEHLGPETTVVEERVKSILSKNDSPDLSFDLSINPYRGCEHGCIYCFARPTHSYLGLSPRILGTRRLVTRDRALPFRWCRHTVNIYSIASVGHATRWLWSSHCLTMVLRRLEVLP